MSSFTDTNNNEDTERGDESGHGITDNATTAVESAKSSQSVGSTVLHTSTTKEREPHGEVEYLSDFDTQYATYDSRVKTYGRWPKTDDKPKPEQLARSGLYCHGGGDGTRCFCCGGTLKNWKPEDDAFVEHAVHFPKCAYIRQFMGDELVDLAKELVKKDPEANRSEYKMIVEKLYLHRRQKYLDQDSTNEEAVGYGDTDEQSTNCSPFPASVIPHTETTKGCKLSKKELGICDNQQINKEYETLESRQETFEKWSYGTDKTKPELLARSGFCYLGEFDSTECFFCRGCLRDWTPQDDPFVEHARWFPHCHYIRQLMGDDFVETVQELKQEYSNSDQFTYEMIIDRLRSTGRDMPYNDDLNLEEDAAVLALIEEGCDKEDVIKAAKEVIKDGEPLSSDLVLRKVKQHKQTQLGQSDGATAEAVGAGAEDEAEITDLKGKNDNLRKSMMCKICLDREVKIVLLPCGHLVSCRECATALMNCPVCRTFIRGTVLASMPSQPNKE